jgi:MerR family transcriptional regulator/heat shock protein HspR
MVNLHPQTLRYYERMGLVAPTRTRGNIRLYSPQEIRRLRSIVRLTDELGVNLAGVEVILSMARKMEEMREEMGRMEAEFERLRARLRDTGASS